MKKDSFKIQDKRILVTGGLGFIGSHLVDKLIKNNDVILIDNLSTGKIENLKKPSHTNLTPIIGDLNYVNLNEILKDVDYVFHLAGMVSVPLSIKNPMQCKKDNLDATVRLLDSCVKCDIKKIIFSSSSSVYGDNSNVPLKESEYPLPKSPYASSKVSCEMYLKSYYESYDLNYVGLRYFNVFGERQNVKGNNVAVISKFVKSLLDGRRPVIYGDGEQTRDFIYVDDIVNANVGAIESNYNGIVNVASGKKITINELLDAVCKILNCEIKAEYYPSHKGEIKHSVADISNMNEINCKVDSSKFEEQLERTVRWIVDECDRNEQRND